jgi:hypothetical protein
MTSIVSQDVPALIELGLLVEDDEKRFILTDFVLEPYKLSPLMLACTTGK